MQDETKSCKSGFNYCGWAKLIVAIPALPILAWMAAIWFENPVWQLVAAVSAVVVAVLGAIWLDRLPALQRKFRKPRD